MMVELTGRGSHICQTNDKDKTASFHNKHIQNIRIYRLGSGLGRSSAVAGSSVRTVKSWVSQMGILYLFEMNGVRVHSFPSGITLRHGP